ncbi:MULTISPECIES: hypothetical protein [unclassified Streptomyces]|uniref:hypothetical protein n=1 Tax=unclassified Streptomyces TaxID=2593676 RepID=UPI00381B1A5B
MISRNPLPPPPPPEGIRFWPDRGARLAERDAALAELAGRGLTAGRLALLGLLGVVTALGWAALGLAVRSLETGGLGYPTGLVALVLALALLVPAVAGAALWLRRGRAVRERLAAWVAVGPDPVTDERLRAHGRTVMWLLPSVAVCLAGLALTLRGCATLMTALGGGAGTEPVTLGETVYALGLGATVLATGLLGLFQAVEHQRWAGRLLHPVPVRARGGAHR